MTCNDFDQRISKYLKLFYSSTVNNNFMRMTLRLWLLKSECWSDKKKHTDAILTRHQNLINHSKSFQENKLPSYQVKTYWSSIFAQTCWRLAVMWMVRQGTFPLYLMDGMYKVMWVLPHKTRWKTLKLHQDFFEQWRQKQTHRNTALISNQIMKLFRAGLTAFTTKHQHFTTTETLARDSHLAQYIDTLFNI